MTASLGVIGVGNIAHAVVTGLCTAPDPPDAIVLSPRGAAHAAALAERFDRVTVASDNQAVADSCHRLILGVRTQDAAEVVGGLTLRDGQPVVSLMSPIADGWLDDALAPGRLEARVLALPAAASQSGPIAICPAGTEAEPLFAQLGELLAVSDPGELLTLFALSSWAAPLYTMLGAGMDWAASHGTDPAVARRYWAAVLESFLGPAAALDGPPIAELVEEAQTAGGLNEQIVGELEAAGVFDELVSALEAVRTRLAAHGAESDR